MSKFKWQKGETQRVTLEDLPCVNCKYNQGDLKTCTQYPKQIPGKVYFGECDKQSPAPGV